MKELKFYSQYYVGIEKSRYEDTEDQRLLGFATPIDTTSAYTKRKFTVDSWRDSNVTPIIFDNIPTFGFEIVDVVSRHQTNNKLYRVWDPRGFELEISAENLFNVLLNNTISKGKILEPLVWARRAAKNYLISSASEEYQQYIGPKKERPLLVAGQYFTHPSNKTIIYRYEGHIHYVTTSMEKNTYDPTIYRSPYWSARYEHTHPKQSRGGIQTFVKYTTKSDHKEPFDVYTEFTLGEQQMVSSVTIHLRKSKLKDLAYYGTEYPNEFITNFVLPYDTSLSQFALNFPSIECISNHDTAYKTKLIYFAGGGSLPNDYRSSDIFLFKSRVNVAAHKLSILDLNTLYNPAYEKIWVNGIYRKGSSMLVGNFFYELYHNGNLIEESD